jgi:hypothetical protein
MPEVLNSVLGTFLGALLGIPTGFALNHCWSKSVDRARRTQLRSVLKRAVDQNDYLADEIEEWLGKGGVPYFNVDLPLLESTASLKYELLDAGLCQEIDHLRYELGHLARKVDLLLGLEFNPSARFAISSPAGSIYNELRPKLVESIRAHLQPIQKTLDQLKGKL